jgi:chromosome partitioning protein
MHTIAFLTQKGGAGKTTLAASLAEVAASTGETVIALDLDPQQSLLRWAERREAAKARNKIVVELLERERLPLLRDILEGLASAGFTLAIFDTTGADAAAVRSVAEVADLNLLPARPTRLDVEATAATFRAVFLAKRQGAFVLPQATAARGPARRPGNSTALAYWPNQCCPRAWIFRMRLPPASASPNMPLAAGQPKK